MKATESFVIFDIELNTIVVIDSKINCEKQLPKLKKEWDEKYLGWFNTLPITPKYSVLSFEDAIEEIKVNYHNALMNND